MKFKLGLILALICLPVLAAPPASQIQKPTVARDPQVPVSELVTTGGNQLIVPAASVALGPRFNCLVQNTSAINTMYISFGKPATVFSLPLHPGDYATCSDGNAINTDAIYIYDQAAGDSLYVLVTILQQF